MPDTRPASGTVHWIGTGLSTGSGLRLLCERAARVTVYGRTREKAERLLNRLSLTGRAQAASFDPETLRAAVAPGDVVVSMLPATEHLGLLRICLPAGAHFACSSYVSEEIAAAATEAAARGLVVLTEAGLDPGIDHLMAHRLVARAREQVGEQATDVRFTSYCGGLPAVPNEFRYQFSWAPRGVLGALRSPARYLDAGTEQTAERPWQATRPHPVGGETFEVYPNRDSLPFVDQYGIPDGWQLRTFVRGTLRLDGWQAAWQPVFDVLETGDTERINALADDLAGRYPTGAGDRDRVVLSVALSARGADGRSWAGEYLLDLVGDAEQTAMARTVSVPLAYGVGRILDGATRPGLHRATDDPAEAARWLAYLERHGIPCRLRP
ncbi:MAG: saccharopine dehydrogenase family protein [Micromonosporaceae bacterium]